MLRIPRWIVLITLVLGPPAMSQQEEPLLDDPMSHPTEHGLRITPELARMIAKAVVEHGIAQRHKLPEDKVEEATEKVARRIMQSAHELDGPAQLFAERFIEEQLLYRIEGNMGFIPRHYGKEFAEGMLKILPEVRKCAAGITADIRPMLPFKEQLKLAGEMMAFHTAVDGFHQTMEKWASGEIDNYENPFDRSPGKKDDIERDDEGVSIVVKNARTSAESQTTQSAIQEWEQYIKEAAQLYEFDETQQATADSILREMRDKVQRLEQDDAWRGKLYRNRLWHSMIWNLDHQQRWQFYQILDRVHEELRSPIVKLGEELKERVDRIPTDSQKRNADLKMDELLIEKGFNPEWELEQLDADSAAKGDGETRPASTDGPEADTEIGNNHHEEEVDQ